MLGTPSPTASFRSANTGTSSTLCPGPMAPILRQSTASANAYVENLSNLLPRRFPMRRAITVQEFRARPSHEVHAHVDVLLDGGLAALQSGQIDCKDLYSQCLEKVSKARDAATCAPALSRRAAAWRSLHMQYFPAKFQHVT